MYIHGLKVKTPRFCIFSYIFIHYYYNMPGLELIGHLNILRIILYAKCSIFKDRIGVRQEPKLVLSDRNIPYPFPIPNVRINSIMLCD